jgi:hypothetical protein
MPKHPRKQSSVVSCVSNSPKAKVSWTPLRYYKKTSLAAVSEVSDKITEVVKGWSLYLVGPNNVF